MRERREKFSIFSEQEGKFCSTQIEGKDSSKEGMEIEEKTTAFIVGPYSPYGMVFEADFWARFLRKKLGANFEVRTVAWKSRQKTGKNKSLIFAALHANRDRNLSFGLI